VPTDCVALCALQVCHPKVGSGREGKPLGWTVADIFNKAVNGSYSLKELWVDLANHIGRHKCYYHYCCLTGRCRFGFGEWSAELQCSTGREVHEEPRIVGGTRPRYQGPTDDPFFIMTVAAMIVSWGGNGNLQPVIDETLEVLQRYLTSYGCKGKASTSTMQGVVKQVLNGMDVDESSVSSLVHKVMQRLVKLTDEPFSFAALMVSGAAPLHRSTRKFTRMSISNWIMLDDVDANPNKKQPRKGPFVRFLESDGRNEEKGLTLYGHLSRCETSYQCTCDKVHVPMVTGIRRYPAWPPTEDFAKYLLAAHLPAFAGTALPASDLRAGRVVLRLRRRRVAQLDAGADAQPAALPRQILEERPDGPPAGVPLDRAWTLSDLDNKFGFESYGAALIAWLGVTRPADATEYTTVPLFLHRLIASTKEEMARRQEREEKKKRKEAQRKAANLPPIPEGGGGEGDSSDDDMTDRMRARAPCPWSSTR
jgi:hypothetical protein